MKESVSADFVVEQPDVGAAIVELKGRDVEHAIKQIFATARHLVSLKKKPSRFAGLIICSQCPKFNTGVQRGKAAFAKEFKAQLHISSQNHEYKIENVLSAKGPLRA